MNVCAVRSSKFSLAVVNMIHTQSDVTCIGTPLHRALDYILQSACDVMGMTPECLERLCSKIGGKDENNVIPTPAWQVFKPHSSAYADLTDLSGQDCKHIPVCIHLNMRDKYAWGEKSNNYQKC